MHFQIFHQIKEKKLQQWFHFYFTLIFRNLILLSRAIYTILFIFSPQTIHLYSLIIFTEAI